MVERSLEILGWWLAITVMASMASAIAYPLFCRWIEGFGPSLRSLVRLVYVSSAPVAASLVVLLATQPTLASVLIPAHCHGNQCGPHTPVIAGDSLLLTGLASLCSLLLLLLMAVLLWSLRRVQRRVRLLSVFTHGSQKGYRTLDSAELLACCVGLFRPHILLSRGMIELLEPGELRIVLAHERAHVARLDNARGFLLRWLTLFWPASLRRWACRDSRADAEQVCDLAAARASGGAQQVAAVIRKLAALSPAMAGTQEHRIAGFDCDDLVTRLSLLEQGGSCDAPSPGSWLKASSGLALNWCVQICLLTAGSHQLIEWLALVSV